MTKRKIFVVLALALFLSACNLPGSAAPTPAFPTFAPQMTLTPIFATQTAPGAEPTKPLNTRGGAQPTSQPAKPTANPYTKINNFVDDSGGIVAEQSPALGTAKCGHKYNIYFPGISAYKTPQGNQGVWWYMGMMYGFNEGTKEKEFKDGSPEMTAHGYFRDAYLNWIGWKGSESGGHWSPGFDAESYLADKPVTFPFFLKCPSK